MSETRDLIRDVLKPGEKIVWTGRPPGWRLVLPRLLPFAFMLVWTGAALLAATGWGQTPPADEDPAATAILALMAKAFLLIGSLVLLVLLRSIIAAWRTHYAVTSQRAVIVQDVWPRSVRSFGPKKLAELLASDADRDAIGALRPKDGDAVGTITLDDPEEKDSFWRGAPLFVGIAKPRQVEKLIRETLLKDTAAESARL